MLKKIVAEKTIGNQSGYQVIETEDYPVGTKFKEYDGPDWVEPAKAPEGSEADPATGVADQSGAAPPGGWGGQGAAT